MQHTSTLSSPSAPFLPGRTVWVLAVASGVAVANLYYVQPLLAELARAFRVPADTMGQAATLAQVGYGCGLLLLVPLGDVLERRGLILCMLGLVALALLAVAFSPSFAWFAVASLALGLTTVSPQLLVPLAATLAAPAERGRVVGTVMSGLLIGILASRTYSGFLATVLGWRFVYVIAAVLSVLLIVALRLLLPRSEPGQHLPYPRLLASLAVLLREEPVLRQSCLFGATTFGAMSAFWNTIAFFLSGPPYDYGSNTIGLFGLVGVAGAAAAAVAGRLADRYSPRLTIGAGIVLMGLAYACCWLAGQNLAWLIVAVVLLDLGAQAVHISNQTRIYAIRPEARNRMNTAYMVCFFIGGSTGSALGAWSWGRWGWPGVCGVSLGMLAVGFAGFLLSRGRNANHRDTESTENQSGELTAQS